jgi:hypothetical protein
MAELTDQNVPMVCPECVGDHIEEGIENMIEHIADVHAHLYTYKEAVKAAQEWAENAYDEFDDWNYEHRLDKTVAADAFPDK